jgi:hypothetical protein
MANLKFDLVKMLYCMFSPSWHGDGESKCVPFYSLPPKT